MRPSLFDDASSVEELLPRDGSAVLHRGAIGAAQQSASFTALRDHVPWEQQDVHVFGRAVKQPRLVAWFGDEGRSYRYSGLKLEPQAWMPEILALRELCEGLAERRFNSVLLNLYRGGQDGVGWHSDNEPELGSEPTIASVSLGTERRFDLRHRDTGETIKTDLPPGSVLVMSGLSQLCWRHQVPKTTRSVGERINLTFRMIGGP